jgi:hypothetical protein
MKSCMSLWVLRDAYWWWSLGNLNNPWSQYLWEQYRRFLDISCSKVLYKQLELSIPIQ